MLVFRLGLERFLQFLPALVGVEIRRVDEFDANRLRECLGAGAGQHHVRRFLHDRSREQDRILDAAHTGDRAGAQGRAVHDRGVEFVVAVIGEHRALAGVEARRVLEYEDRLGDRIHAAAAAFQHRVAGIERRFEIGAGEFFLFRGQRRADHPGAAVDHEYWHGGFSGLGDQAERDGNKHAQEHRRASMNGWPSIDNQRFLMHRVAENGSTSL